MPKGNVQSKIGNTYQPPSGGRDLLPLDVVQKRWIEDRLEEVFQQWGYHRIITPTVETMDTLMAGGAIERVEVIELQIGEVGEQRLGLRPELTASIARAAVTRLASVTYPQRLYYNANVFRRPSSGSSKGSQGGQQEYHQAGIELLGSSGLMADAEVVLLAADCLRAVNLADANIVLGEAALTYSLLTPFPEDIRETVRQNIAELNRVGLETLPLNEALRSLALRLMDLRGQPEAVIQTLTNDFALDSQQQSLVNRLKQLIELLSQRNMPAVTLDLSLIRPFDYYTGIVFEIVSNQQRQRLGQGGRYDDLLAVYDTAHSSEEKEKGFPGIGFVLNIDQLRQELVSSGDLPSETPPSDWLIVPKDETAAAAALDYAQKARASANIVRVELSLDFEQSADEVRAIAHKRNITRIAWISDQGLPDIELVN
ncbi:MAG: ATP phosphoribosyltransferase regulatory subunit [Cyanobacteria bacterium J06621_11]